MFERDPERQEWAVEQLKAHSLDAFICATPANVLMLSGYWPVIGKSLAIVTREGELTLIVPEDEMQLASLHGASLVPYSPGAIDRFVPIEEALAHPLAKTLEKLRLGGCRMGIETGPLLIPAAYVSVHIFGKQLSCMLKCAVDHVSLIPSDDALAYLRARLTTREVVKLKIACEIAAFAYSQGVEGICAGATEAGVAAAFRKNLFVNVGYKGAERTDGSVWCMSGPNSARAYAAFQRSTERRLRQGELALIHCNSFADGYWTDITRTYTVGHSDDRTCKMLTAIAEARAAAIDAVRPGVKASDVDAAAREVMREHGFGDAFRHGTGHGVGFAAIDHDAAPRLMPNSTDTIELGMAFNIEPGAYFEGFGGARHCDMVLCTATGAEVLTDF